MSLFEQLLTVIRNKDSEKIVDILNEHPRFGLQRDFELWTPLHYGVETGDINIVETLLLYPHEINGRTRTNYTPFHLMITTGNYSLLLARVLIENGADVGPELNKAIYLFEQSTIEHLIEETSCINICDEFGNSPLHIAIETHNQPALELLIANGANLDATDWFHTTPLHTAAANGELEALIMLLNHGAHLEIKDENGRNALIFAAGNGNLNEVAYLLKKGAFVNAQDYFGNTALHYAYENEENAVIEMLLAADADNEILNVDSLKPIKLLPQKDDTE